MRCYLHFAAFRCRNTTEACIHVTKNVAPAENTHGSNIRFSLMKGLYESTLASRIIVTTIKALHPRLDSRASEIEEGIYLGGC